MGILNFRNGLGYVSETYNLKKLESELKPRSLNSKYTFLMADIKDHKERSE